MTAPGVHPDDMFDDPLLAEFARDLRAASASTPPPVVGAALAAVLEGREVAGEPPWLPSSRPRRRRTGMRWVVGGAVFGLGIGSLGVAGALPDPVQRQVANLGDVVGVHLPDPATDTPATSVVPTTVPPSTVPPARTSHPTTTTVDDPGADHRGGAGQGDEHGPPTTVEDHGKGNEGRGGGNVDEGTDDDGNNPAANEDRGASVSDNDDEGDEGSDRGRGKDAESIDERSPTESVEVELPDVARRPSRDD